MKVLLRPRIYALWGVCIDLRWRSSRVVCACPPQGRTPLVPEELRPAVVDIDDPRTVEHVTSGSESRWNAGRKSEIEERPESQEHAPTLVRNGRSAFLATELTRKSVDRCPGLGMVEMESFETAHEAHIGLVKDHGPLEGRTVQGPTRGTVAEHRIHRVGTGFKGNRTTETLGAVLRRERRVVGVGRRVSPAPVFCHHGPQDTTMIRKRPWTTS